jgi:hypothetical protein
MDHRNPSSTAMRGGTIEACWIPSDSTDWMKNIRIETFVRRSACDVMYWFTSDWKRSRVQTRLYYLRHNDFCPCDRPQTLTGVETDRMKGFNP